MVEHAISSVGVWIYTVVSWHTILDDLVQLLLLFTLDAIGSLSFGRVNKLQCACDKGTVMVCA